MLARLNYLLTLTMLLPVLALASPDTATVARCPEVRIEVKQMPDLNIPRAGHQTFCVNGELTVAGGHTDGFVPTPTAEYYKDGEWHSLQMTYPHDFGFSVVLSSGQVMLGGGCDQPIGIGQTYLTETYDPQTHTFNGYCSLQRKRAGVSALELDSGKVVVAGNWYFTDGIELFHDKSGTQADYNGKRLFTYIKDVSVEHSKPYIFRIANDNAIIFGGNDVKGDTIWSTIADQLKGDPVHIPLFEDWRPIASDNFRSSENAIGDESKGVYSYLFGVENRQGQVAIAKADNGVFSLLPTACPVPMQSHGDEIWYASSIIADKKAGRAYLFGLSRHFHAAPEKPWRWYILSIDYTKQPADLTLYYTDPLPDFHVNAPVLTDDGNLLIAGGLYHGSNFTPSKRVLLLCVGQEPVVAESSSMSLKYIVLLILLALVIMAIILYLFIYIGKRRKRQIDELPDDVQEQDPVVAISDEASARLMERIYEVMEAQKLYQDCNLKVNDLAATLGTNRRTVSDCINSQKGCNFTQFVNIYRVDHAKRAMLQNPDKKIADIYIESGFANEGSFFRTFKAVTGMTPKEWLSKA
jgi:AraC-like DNA-binding protein